MKIQIADIVNDSIVDGPGLRLALFVQGCPHKCPGCHNPQTHDPSGGRPVSPEEVLAIIEENPLLDGITLSGGEPFCQSKALVSLCEKVKKKHLTIIAYTGYTWERLILDPDMLSLAEKVDFVIDGPFIMAERTLDLRFRGSKNQRVIDVKKSLAKSKAVESEF